MARVLVTGANGFLGSELVRVLHEHGHQVVAMMRAGREAPSFWPEEVEVFHGDITRADDTARACEGIEVIHHVAAVVGDWSSDEEHARVTIGGTRNVLDAAGRNGARVVLASSVTVYGDHLGRRPCDETVPHGRPMGSYSRAKQAQERLCEERSDVDTVIIRPANIYGPGSGPWLHDLGVQLKAGMPAQVGNRGNNAGLAYVTNVADVFALAQDKAAAGDIYNACDGLDVTWKQYMTDLARLLECRGPKHMPYGAAWLGARIMEGLWRLFRVASRPPITREAFNIVAHDNCFPSERARGRLGWEPRVSYEEALEATREYLARHPL